jgi:hypothetical protein
MGTQANIAKVKVELPLQLPSRLTTLQKACTNAQFEANPAACPVPSFIGHAVVHTPLVPVPLEGPAIFVSHGGEAFPSLEIVLQGYGVKVILVGATFISHSGITSTTFHTIPDQPFNTFELVLHNGPYSALAANGNLCAPTTTKTVSKKVKLKVHGHKKTETRKVKQTVAGSLVMPNEFTAQNGAIIKQDTTISVEGCKPSIFVVRHSVKGRTATLVVSVPEAGKLVAGGNGLSRGTWKSGGAGDITVKVHLSNREAAFLAQHHRQRLAARVKLSFTPQHGARLSTSLTVLVGRHG